MFKRKFVRQENLKDCGAACLLMIIKYYGGNYPLEQLRELLKIDKKGTTAFNIIEAAKKIGFDCSGYKTTDYSTIVCPCIAHIIRDKTYHHFVVIQKVDLSNQLIHIADPALGLKKYTFAEFDLIWTNVIITFYPIRKIDNINIINNIKETMCQLINPYKKLFIVIFLLSIIYTVLNILNTFYFKLIIDNTNIVKNAPLIVFVFFSCITIMRLIIDFVRNKLLIIISSTIEKQLMSTAFKHLLELPWQYFNSRTTGDIVSRLNDLNYVKELISRGALILLMDFVLIIGSTIVLCIINYYLFLIIAVILATYFFAVYFFNRSIKYFIMKRQEEESLTYSALIESLSGIETIKNLCIEPQVYDKVMRTYDTFVNNNYQFDLKYNKVKLIKDIILYNGMVLILFVGGIFVSNNSLSVSDFILFNFFASFFLEPLKSIFDFEPLLRTALSALVRVSEFYNIERDKDNGLICTIKGNIDLKNISFSYNRVNVKKYAVDATICAGTKVMITGPSGIGKSTLAKMLIRYLDPFPNQILIDNNDIAKYSVTSLRQQICYISQNESFFTDSLYNNVVLGRIRDDSKIETAFKVACLDDVISKHRGDRHMLLEENAINLSGGERQRLMIARALLKDSQIYIFDESMSEMNADLERNILNNIFENYKDKTIIVISHRLDNVDLFDKVIKMKNDMKEGKI